MKKNRYIHILNGLYYIGIKETGFHNDDWVEESSSSIFVTSGKLFRSCVFASDVKKIDYPLSTNYYFDNTMPLFSDENQNIIYSTICNIIQSFTTDKEGEHYYFDTIMNRMDLDFINNFDFRGIKVKGYNYLQYDLINLFSLDQRFPKQFLVINEIGVCYTDKNEVKVNMFPSTKKSIEKSIRDKNYFLCYFLESEIFEIVQGIFQELFSTNRKNECIVRDTLIYIDDEDYQVFESELMREIYENLLKFENKFNEIVLLDFMLTKKGKSILSSSFNKLEVKQINIFKFLDILCDYRKLNISVSKSVYKNAKKHPFSYYACDYEFIKKNMYLLNQEKTEYKKRLERMLLKLSSVNDFYFVDKKIEV